MSNLLADAALAQQIVHGPFWISPTDFVTAEVDANGQNTLVLKDFSGVVRDVQNIEFAPDCVDDRDGDLLMSGRGETQSVLLNARSARQGKLELEKVEAACSGFIPAKRDGETTSYQFDGTFFSISPTAYAFEIAPGQVFRFDRPQSEALLFEKSYDIQRTPDRSLVYHRTTSRDLIQKALMDGDGLRVFDISTDGEVTEVLLQPPVDVREQMFRSSGYQVFPVGEKLFAVLVADAGAWVTDAQTYVRMFEGPLTFNRFRSVLQRRGTVVDLIPRDGAVSASNSVKLIDAENAFMRGR